MRVRACLHVCVRASPELCVRVACEIKAREFTSINGELTKMSTRVPRDVSTCIIYREGEPTPSKILKRNRFPPPHTRALKAKERRRGAREDGDEKRMRMRRWEREYAIVIRQRSARDRDRRNRYSEARETRTPIGSRSLDACVLQKSRRS